VIRLWCPGIDLNAVFESNNKKFDAFILDDLEVNSTLEISYINPPISTLNLLEMDKIPTDQSDVQCTTQAAQLYLPVHHVCFLTAYYTTYSLLSYYTWK
jgi:hypothetical protein